MTEHSLYLKIATDLRIDVKQVKATVELLDEGATVPFISRYRKDTTGNLDEVVIEQIAKLQKESTVATYGADHPQAA